MEISLVLVEELRGTTFMKVVVYYFTKVGKKYKYEVREWWGLGRGHPGNKIPRFSMVFRVGLGVKNAFQGLPVYVNMGFSSIL